MVVYLFVVPFFNVKWKNKFYDFKDIIKKKTNINPLKYTSGSIYKAFNIKMGPKHKIHNSYNDILSMYEVCKLIL